MMKSITAYFKSENDAESARIRLQSLRVDNVSVEYIPEEDDHVSFIPVLPTSTGSLSPGIAVVPEPEHNRGEFDDPGRMTHLIEVKVNEEDYEKAMKIIQQSNGYKSSNE